MAGVVGVYRTKHRRGQSCRERERGRETEREERRRKRAKSRETQKVLAESSAKC